jgi:hypothetical protein
MNLDFKTVNGFPNYEINKLGQVRNKKTKDILAKFLSPKGYYVRLQTEKKLIHLLLAPLFVSNPYRNCYVKFIDGNVRNHDVDNLTFSRKCQHNTRCAMTNIEFLEMLHPNLRITKS